MAENETVQEVKQGPKSIEEFLKLTKFPDEALAPVLDKVSEYLKLVAESNKLVASVNAAKANDPNNAEHLDKLWESLYTSDPEMVEIEAEFQAVTAERERLLSKLRDFAKKNIPESLTPEATAAAKKKVNDFAPTLAESRKGIASMLVMPETMLGVYQVAIPEGGLVSLLPQAESLKNARGRKASTSDGIPIYTTRVGEVLIDGASTNRDGKGKLDYAANVLTERFNGKAIPENKVTTEEIEEAYWKALGKDFRSVKSTELPLEKKFVFEKVTKVQNTNDDGFTDIPQKVEVTVRSVNWGTVETTTPETKSEVSEPAKANEPAMKIDTRTEDEKAKANQATKKVAPAPAKK